MQSTYGSEPLLRPYKGVWLLGGPAWKAALLSKDDPGSTYLTHATTDSAMLSQVALEWLAEHDAVTTGDLMEFTGVSRGTAQRVLTDLEGTDLKRVGGGPSTRFVRRSIHR